MYIFNFFNENLGGVHMTPICAYRRFWALNFQNSLLILCFMNEFSFNSSVYQTLVKITSPMAAIDLWALSYVCKIWWSCVH